MRVIEAPPERGGASRVRLALAVDLLADHDDVLLVRDGTRATHRLRRPTPDEREILRRLAGGFTTRAALEADTQPAPVAGVLATLAAAGALEWRVDPDRSPLAPQDAERFDRQLPYLAELDPSRRAEDVQRRLLDAHVTILGCGGLGTWTAQALLCAGVRRLRLIDPDRVELSNLNRQPLYGERDIGRPKVEAARDALLRVDAAARIEPVRQRVGTEDEALGRLRGTQILVNTADWPPYELEHLVDRACLRLGLAHLTAGQQPPLIRVGPFSIPGRTPCHACSERALERGFPLYAALKAARRATPRPATTLGPASGLVGTIIASEVMHALTGAVRPATVGRAFLIDLRSLTSRAAPIAAEDRCRGCRLQSSGIDRPLGTCWVR